MSYQMRPAPSCHCCTSCHGTGINSFGSPVDGSRMIQSYPLPPSSRLVSSTFLRANGVIASFGRTLSRYRMSCDKRSRLRLSITKLGSFAMLSLRISIQRSTALSFLATLCTSSPAARPPVETSVPTVTAFLVVGDRAVAARSPLITLIQIRHSLPHRYRHNRRAQHPQQAGDLL